jgi:hypothetical protein
VKAVVRELVMVLVKPLAVVVVKINVLKLAGIIFALQRAELLVRAVVQTVVVMIVVAVVKQVVKPLAKVLVPVGVVVRVVV